MRARLAKAMSVTAWAAALLVAWTSVAGAATAAAVSPDAPVQPVQPLSVVRAPFLVSYASQLPPLMKDDSLLDQRANDLVAGQHRAIAAFAIGAGAAVVLGLVSVIDEQDDCFGSGLTRLCQRQPNWTLLAVAGGLFAASIVTGVVLSPHDNLVDVVNAWNQAHPDRPLALAPGIYVSDPTPPPATP
jgi:hypothetical protein